MEYVERLRRFNNTEKYDNEMAFMFGLIGDGSALDYGCGIGKMVKERSWHAVTYGYDKMWYEEGEPEHWWIRNVEGEFNHTYFMHSLAHIENPDKVIREVSSFSHHIEVITPNLEWLELKGQHNYNVDPTVIGHFSSASLEDLFMGFRVIAFGQLGERIGNQHERLFIKVKT